MMDKRKPSYKINVITCAVSSFVIMGLLIIKDDAVSKMDKAVNQDQSLIPASGSDRQRLGVNFPEAEVVKKWQDYFSDNIKIIYIIFLAVLVFLLIAGAMITILQIRRNKKRNISCDYQYYRNICILFFAPFVIPIIHEFHSITFWFSPVL